MREAEGVLRMCGGGSGGDGGWGGGGAVGEGVGISS